MALLAIFTTGLIALPPAFAMDLMERVITTQTQFIRREATEYQRKMAEANARAYMTAQLHAHHHASTTAAAATSKSGKSGDSTAKSSGSTTKTQSKDEAQEMSAFKKTLPRYIAVDTPKDERSAPGTKKDVMIWDTQSEALVGNYVYDVSSSPAIGGTAKFDTYSAQYVGNGL
jgi:hypothetical protein